MKKLILFLMVITLIMCGCGKKEEPIQEEGNPDWQTQYDLGMRFLSDGDWEQAIPAFLEAIQIDPRRTETYLSLADAYLFAGQPDKAMEVLENAPDDVDAPESLANKIQEVSENISGTLTDADDEMDEGAKKNTGPFDERTGYVKPDQLTSDQETMIEAVIDSISSGESPEEAFGHVPAGTNISTQWNGYKIKIYAYEMEMSCAEYYGGVTWASGLSDITNRIQLLNVEMRPENGIGYRIQYQITEGGLNPVFDGEDEAPAMLDDSADIVAIGAEIGAQYISSFITCPCVEWQWNGTMTDNQTIENRFTGEYTRGKMEEGWPRTDVTHMTETGTMVNGLRAGTFKSVSEFGEGETYESENIYDSGELVGISGAHHSDIDEVIW